MKGALAMAVAFLGGCTGPSSTLSQDLRVQVSAEPISVDPARIEDGAGLRLAFNAMDGLVGYDAEGRLELLLAESRTLSPDGRKLRYVLRESARWSDGLPVRAQEVVKGIRRALHPQTGSKLAEFLEPIRGARAFRRTGQGTLAGLRAEGERDVVIELERPSPWFEHALTLPQAAPQRSATWTPESPTTGAYLFPRAGDAVGAWRMLPNPHYWRGGARLPIRLEVVEEEATAARLFDQGRLDLLTRVPLLEQKRFEAAGRIRRFPMVATYFLAFRVDRGPFARKEVRQAISRAIRRDELALALGTGDVPSDGWVPQGLEGSRDLQSPVPHLALSTLDLPSPGPLLVFDQGERNRLILEKVQADLKKRLGVNLRLEGKDWKSHVRGLAEGRFQMYRFGWVAPFLDPITHLQVFTSQNPNNFTAWRDPRYDSMVERISALAPGTERAQKIREADLYLTREESIVVPLLHYVQSYAVAPRVRGLRALPNLVIPFRELTLE